MVVCEPVQAAIWHCLNHYAYRDAIFLAERLLAEVASDEALFLLATCYYRSGKPTRAYTILQSAACPTPQCRFLMAQCCIDINKLSEAENALTGGVFQRNKTLDDITTDFGDTASFALRLMARIYSKSERRTKAVDSYRRSLKLNPFLWSSYEALCHIGDRPDPCKMFQVNSQVLPNACPSHPLSVTPIATPTPRIPATLDTQPTSLVESVCLQPTESSPAPLAVLTNPQIINATPDTNLTMDTTPVNLTAPQFVPSAPRPQRPKLPAGPASSYPASSPSFGVLPLSSFLNSLGSSMLSSHPLGTQSPMDALADPSSIDAPTKTKKPMTRRSQQQPSAHTKPTGPFSQSNSNTNSSRADMQTTPSSQTTLQGGNAPALRRSSRLFTNASSSVKENNKSQRKFSCPNAPAKRTKSKSIGKMAQEMNEINRLDKESSENKPSTVVDALGHALALQKQSAEGLMQLFQTLGKAYTSLSQYDCAEALNIFVSLPPHHYNTGWVLSQVGRAHFEMADYQKAESVFSELRDRVPHQLEGLELYSTTLWHLQREVQLSTLGHQIMEYDKHTPEACCIVGNCFSLQKEHDTAIRFFQRAVQLDEDFAYAYTLLGHEYVLTEELDKALACFRNAIRVDPRHYNAWYGVGMVYYKQEKFSLAEVHFRQALSINPQSSVLLCHIGVVQHALQKSDNALVTLEKAIEADPKNPLCKFHRASILFASDRHKEALSELEELKQIVPRESLVYFLIGKVHKKLGNTHLALMNFSWAMDLDPKGANNQIKEAINKRYVTEDDDSPAIGDASALEDPLERSSNASSLMDGEEAHLEAIESDESL